MMKYQGLVNQRGFTASNLFALQQIEKAVEEMVGRTAQVLVLDLGPSVGVVVDLKSTGRSTAIYYALLGTLVPLGYVIRLDGTTVYVSPMEAE